MGMHACVAFSAQYFSVFRSKVSMKVVLSVLDVFVAYRTSGIDNRHKVTHKL